MSLKAFHIFFICASTLLALGFSVWEINGYFVSNDVLQLLAGVVSFGVAIGLTVYGIRFMKKLKHVRMI